MIGPTGRKARARGQRVPLNVHAQRARGAVRAVLRVRVRDVRDVYANRRRVPAVENVFNFILSFAPINIPHSRLKTPT